jgi:hypothetical protein
MELSSAAMEAQGLPEVSVAAFAFLLNFPWEVWHIQLYRSLETQSYREAVTNVTVASVGDAVLAVIAFWAVAAATRSRVWILHPTPKQIAGFVGVGLGITIAWEWVATEVLGWWQYAETMPTLPFLGTGVSPVLQWILLPPLVVWLVRRQLT